MNISYISDIHLDFHVPFTANQLKWESNTRKFTRQLIKTDETQRDIILLGGDYSHFNHQTMWMLDEFSNAYTTVLMVLGNHDYYLVSKSQSEKYGNSSANRADELRQLITDSLPNVYLLEEGKIYEHEGVRIGGDTMWYPLTTTEQQTFFRNISNDSKLIKNVSIELEHEKSIRYYKSMIENEIDIMLSHVPLIHINSHSLYGGTACYLTDVDELPTYVVMGHSHEQSHYEKASTEFHMNCLGYPHDRLKKKKIESFKVKL